MRKRILTLAMVTILIMAFIVSGCTKKNSLNEPVDVTEKDTTTSVENDTTSVEDETTSGNEAIEDETTAAVEDGTTEAEGEVSTEDVTTSEDVTTVPEDETTKKEPVESVTTAPTTKPTVAPTKPAVTNPTTVAPTTKPTVAPTKPATKPTVAPTVAPTAKPTTVAPTQAPVKPTVAPTTAAPETSKVPSNWKKVQVYSEFADGYLNYYTDGTWIFEYTGDPLNKLYRESITDYNYSYLTVNYKNLFYGGRPVEKEVIFLVKYVGNEENLEIPKTINGIDVLGLDSDFCERSQVIKTLTIPETIVEGGISLVDTNITKVVVKGTKWRPVLTATGLNSEIGTVIYCEKEVYEFLMTRASTATCTAVFKSLDGKITYRDEKSGSGEYPEYYNPTI